MCASNRFLLYQLAIWFQSVMKRERFSQRWPRVTNGWKEETLFLSLLLLVGNPMTKSFIFSETKKNFSFLHRLYPQRMAWRMLEEGRWLGRTTTQARTTFQNPKGWWSRFGKDIYHGIKSAGRNFANRIPVHAVGGWSASGGRRSQFRMVMVVAPIKPQVLAWCYTPLTPSGRDLWWVSTNIDTDNPLLRNCPSLPPEANGLDVSDRRWRRGGRRRRPKKGLFIRRLW